MILILAIKLYIFLFTCTLVNALIRLRATQTGHLSTSSPLMIVCISWSPAHMMTQGAAQPKGRQMGMTAAPCLPPSDSE